MASDVGKRKAEAIRHERRCKFSFGCVRIEDSVVTGYVSLKWWMSVCVGNMDLRVNVEVVAEVSLYGATDHNGRIGRRRKES